MEWYLKGIKDNYANFNGRARRKEFWMFFLFYVIFMFAAIIVDNILGTDFKVGNGYYEVSTGYGWIFTFYYLAMFCPYLAVGIRRLHDINKSGWFILVSLIPLIGSIWLIILLFTDGNTESNQYGEPTK
jgi:uncharacterized membrane protein YhaH (DUF805 family)